MSDKIINVTDASFEAEVLNSDIPVLVDFWAPWCGPCKMMAPTLDALAEEQSDVKIVKINVDEHGEQAQKFGVRGIPTLILFDHGVVKTQKTGGLSKGAIQSLIRSAIQ